MLNSVRLALRVSLLVLAPVVSAQQADSVFNSRTEMIPMRDGIKLHTRIFTPRQASGPLPILMVRTPYGIDGYSSARTGLVGNGRQIVDMTLITGTVLVVPGQGAQMSLLRNFGRGEQTAVGFSLLDCGSTSASSTPASWVCRGTVTITGQALTNARPLRLTKGESGGDATMP